MRKISKICCLLFIAIIVLIIITLKGCYGRDSKITLYDTLAELKEKEDIEFIDFHDPLVYLLEDRLIHLSEDKNLGIVVPPRNEKKRCWFNLSKEDEELLYVNFARNSDLSHPDGIKYANNHKVEYWIEDEEDCFIVFEVNGIKYKIIVYHYNEKFTTEQILDKIVEYLEIEYSEMKYELPGIVSLV